SRCGNLHAAPAWPARATSAPSSPPSAARHRSPTASSAFPVSALESRPKSFLAGPAQTPETAVWYSSLASGVGSFTGDFVAVTTKPTPSLFLHTQNYVTFLADKFLLPAWLC